MHDEQLYAAHQSAVDGWTECSIVRTQVWSHFALEVGVQAVVWVKQGMVWSRHVQEPYLCSQPLYVGLQGGCGAAEDALLLRERPERPPFPGQPGARPAQEQGAGQQQVLRTPNASDHILTASTQLCHGPSVPYTIVVPQSYHWLVSGVVTNPEGIAVTVSKGCPDQAAAHG